MKSLGRVAIGLSGGVDSSVSAALLLEAGWDVIGVHLQMARSIPGWEGFGCTSAADRQDAIRAAAHLGLPIEIVDAEKAYTQDILESFFEAYARGLTPNPDVECNARVKFPFLLAAADRLGATHIATGHYARTDGKGGLLRGVDPEKDQSYFLATLPEATLARTLFPVGNLLKTDVRKKAAELGLPAAVKKDSVGLCFVGDVPVSDLLRARLPRTPGLIVDTQGQEVGQHDGLSFYTIGQRHGLSDLRRPGPWYVVGKNAEKNVLIVTDLEDDSARFKTEIFVTRIRWIAGVSPKFPARLGVQLRHRDSAHLATTKGDETDLLQIRFDEPIPAVAPGQIAAFYDGDDCLGAGAVASSL